MGKGRALRFGPVAAFLAAVVVASASCGDSPTPPIETDPPDALGPRVVGHVGFEAIDIRREDRSLPVDVWYPADDAGFARGQSTFYALAGPIGLDSEIAREGVPASAAGPWPLLVFSHGYGGVRLQSIELMEGLASHGFVVASVGHTGNTQSSPGDDFDTAASKRVPDVSFVIDAMFARGRDRLDLLAGRIDEGAVGALGHSFGAMTAIGMAAGWAGSGPDPRVGAILPISAVIEANLQSDRREGPNAGFTPAQLARVAIPVLLVGGTEDVNVPIANNELAFEWMVDSPRIYKLAVAGANHNHFASVCTFGELLLGLGIGKESWPAVGAADLVAPFDAACGPGVLPIEEVSRLVRTFAVAFFRRHLGGEAGYGRFLTAEYARTQPAASLEVR